ncbi:SagB/ThcOx family dehydrogenase [Amycolatopsis magusensis]|uniref:SagB/ThcOx family dehydrogenase n=1 Tax=Amycolatopsis magusensis TaxID=882444 RepID=UPI003792CEE7
MNNYLLPTSNPPVRGHVVSGKQFDFLTLFDEWVTVEDILERAAERWTHEEIRDAIDAFCANGWLITRDSPEADAEGRLEHAWPGWSPSATQFFFTTHDVRYQTEVEERDSGPSRGEGPPPPLFKQYPDSPVVPLPKELPAITADLGTTLLTRRTHRSYRDQPVTFEQFSTVVNYTLKPTLFFDGDVYGPLMMRTSPCGGARGELEAYIAVFNVEGVEPGLYHYNTRTVSLELLDASFTRDDARHIAFDYTMAPTCGFVVYLTAVLERATYKYRMPRQLRVIFLDAGALGQTFVLTATGAGLGAWQSAAIRDGYLEDKLGIDGITEVPVYMFGAGISAHPLDGRPPDYRVIPPPSD